MRSSPLLEAYRREHRQELTYRWLKRSGVAMALLAVALVGYVYHSGGDDPQARQAPVPLSPAPPALLATAGGPVDLGPTPDLEGLALPRAPRAPLSPAETHVEGELRPKARLLDLLLGHGADADEVAEAMRALERVYDARKLRPHQRYEMWRGVDGHIDRLLLHLTSLRYVEVVREGGVFVAREREFETRSERVRVLGTVQTTLGAALEQAGERASLALMVRDFFSPEIDFRSHVRRSDQFRILVEKVMVGDRFVQYGSILAAEYRGQMGIVRAFRYEQPDLGAGVYDEQGQSLQRLFLRHPVPGARITSRFSLRRLHPILKRYRPHLGIDYAAPTGTPVQAVADGQVIFAGQQGQNGLLLVLRHAGGYKSHYGHLHRLAKGIRSGVKVRRGQVVASVGNSGLSTGPHLHYGLSRDGRYLDPEKLPAVRAEPVSPEHMADYLATIGPLTRELESMAMQDEALFGDLVLPP